MAHPCWRLNEIVGAIATNLVLDGEKSSAISLARCSRSFEESVLREVWRSLSSLAPLVKCFPPEVWELNEEGKLVFKRAPFRIEWARFQQQYAPKVRHLTVCPTAISISALQLLQLYSHYNPVLPNLMSVFWFSDDEYLPFISSFISHSLTSITIIVDTGAVRILPPILARVSKMATNISDITVRQPPNDLVMEEASSQLLMECNPQRLRRYNVGAPLSASAISRIIQFPLLEEFSLVAPFHLPDSLPNVVCPSLRVLDVEFNGDPAWLKLLPAIESPIFSGIHFQFTADSDVAQFMETFQQTVTGCGMHERLKELKLQCTDELNTTPQIISHISSFKNLTWLSLLSQCDTSCQTSDLTDDDIDLLTNAMPGLERLMIGGEPCGVPSKITFNSLYTISRRCTRLTSLEIHFNPNSFINKVTAVPDSGNVGFETPSSGLCSVAYLSVGSIVLPRQPQVSYIMAMGLLGVFPDFERVVSFDSSWQDVNRLIIFCRRIRTALVRRSELDRQSPGIV